MTTTTNATSQLTPTGTHMNRSVSSYTALLLTLLVAACGGGDADKADAGATVAPAAIVLAPMDIATAEMRTISEGVALSGNLDPADVVQLKAQVPGTVTQVRVDRGSAVRSGTPMAVIEAQGIRGQAAGAAAQVVAARAQLSIAQQRLAGAKKLFDAGAISSIEYKTAEANVDAAEANVAVAVAQAAGAGESAARATITSPINGVVSARMVSGGEAVNVGTDLFTVVNASELELAGQVGVREAAMVRVGLPVSFTLDANPGLVLRGRVARVDPTADPGTRQVGVYVRVGNPGNRIVGGQFARGTIETGSSVSALVIPPSAIVERSGDNASVFVIAADKLSKRAVVLGAVDQSTGLIAVTSGLIAGDRVLLNPTTDSKDGVPVTIAGNKPVTSDPAKPATADSVTK